ncbi:MAG TPA: ATP-dependent 6-phosphofructokinase [Deltaproteobacteria bacterium]|nr:ATP-dependent 6-phosphofructokinase [Deltaproteobacteria bacterium]HPR54385.1 ATP-dependent 6-phosphofructokinase [Deltaproteobacteria bacterium]HXK48404.1 ATP-dependent 6-phosphofructokinase [Deltaproteobacteria bacterium]
MNQNIIEEHVDTSVHSLGRSSIESPVQGTSIFVDDSERVVIDTSLAFFNRCAGGESVPVSFELAGPRKKIFFDPSKTKCGIVTCGGLCPGINDVIRGIVLELHYAYHVENIYGIPYGLQGLIPSYKHPLIELTPGSVEQIHEIGGTVLGSSRGSQDISEMVDAIERLNMNIVFFIGGDGTLKAASSVAREALARGFRCSVIAVPKTIDNDIYFVSKTFGFDTAVEEARKVIKCAHVEAKGAPNGIGLVKVMGRDSGFIAANAALASRDANFVLVPEEDFDLDGPKGFLSTLEARLKSRGHAVIVVAEGAGQKFFRDLPEEKDASGNVRKHDIGHFLKGRLDQHFQSRGMPTNLKYLDPSYIIRSVTANASDSIFCGFLAQMAVHAGMSGKTDMLIGLWNNVYVHIPNEICMKGRKKIDTDGPLWMSVRESTGQPLMIND